MDEQALLESFRQCFDAEPTYLVRSPGRVNLLGEHVDYNDGPVLPAAIDRAIWMAAQATGGNAIELFALDFNERTTISLEAISQKVAADGKALPGWALYPAGVAWALQQAGFELGGIRAVYTSDLPIGAGLSSSAAVEVGFGMLWNQAYHLGIERLRLAELCQRAENEYVGLACGLMDQFASACGVEGHAMFFDTRSRQWQALPLPPGTAIVIADSGVRRSLSHSGYNERRAACEQAVRELQAYLPHIRSLRDVATTELAAYAPYLSEIPRKRAEHVVKEIARVGSALSALKRNDRQALGALMYAGHKSLRDLYEVSTPELDALVELSRHLPGCIGARLTGAGFGGCTVNLVEIEHAQAFIEGLKAGYQQAVGRQAQVYLCRASQGATIL